MSEDDPLESLLEKLGSGDGPAAEQAFVAYEPYLRMVVRRLLPMRLRSKFDSVDVVQSIWADLWHGFRHSGWQFNNVAQLRAFLVKATRNRFIDRVRQHGTASNRERPLEFTDHEDTPMARDPAPSEVAQADDLWEQLLTLCPPTHHQLLVMKRQGASLAEIAERTGLHESSVRRILYDLARKLAFQQQQA